MAMKRPRESALEDDWGGSAFADGPERDDLAGLTSERDEIAGVPSLADAASAFVFDWTADLPGVPELEVRPQADAADEPPTNVLAEEGLTPAGLPALPSAVGPPARLADAERPPDGATFAGPGDYEAPQEDPVARAMRAVPGRDAARLEVFAYRVVVLGESAAVAGLAVGWSVSRAYYIHRTPYFEQVRAAMLAKYRVGRDAVMREIAELALEAARDGALRQARIVRDLPLDSRLAFDASKNAMDQVGARTPAKVETRVEVDLTADTLALIAKAGREAALVPQDLAGSTFAYALEKPRERPAEEAARLLGRAGESTQEARVATPAPPSTT